MKFQEREGLKLWWRGTGGGSLGEQGAGGVREKKGREAGEKFKKASVHYYCLSSSKKKTNPTTFFDFRLTFFKASNKILYARKRKFVLGLKNRISFSHELNDMTHVHVCQCFASCRNSLYQMTSSGTDSIKAFMTTSRRFKCVPQILGSLRIHIFMLLFSLIIYAYRLFAEVVACYRGAQTL